jgi:flagellar biosynthesis regulator FlbT
MKVFIVLTIAILLSACSEVTKSITVDNPTEDEVVFSIDDGEEITIPPKTSKELIVKYGNRKVILNNSEEEIILESDYDYLLNPTKSNYYIETIVYMADHDQERFRKEFGTYMSVVEGSEIEGEFKKIESQLLIPKTWHFGIGEEPNNNLKVDFSGKNYFFKRKKLHRASDIKEVISDAFQEMLQELLNKDPKE